jgi:predicted nucleic acid-binding protein
MRFFCDTSVFVAALMESHVQHAPALTVLRFVIEKRHQGFTAAHALAETYSVITRLPLSPRVPPGEAFRLMEENIFPHFTLLALAPDDYPRLVREVAAEAIAGGMIYDALILACAVKARADRIYTFNVAHFRRIAPQLHKKIMAP